MWVFTTQGYLSVVDKEESGGELCVRSRDDEDLKDLQAYLQQALRKGVPIMPTGKADYQYRMFVEREDFMKYMVQMIRELKYDNFKDACSYKEDSVWRRKPEALYGLARIWETIWETCSYNRFGVPKRAQADWDPEKEFL